MPMTILSKERAPGKANMANGCRAVQSQAPPEGILSKSMIVDPKAPIPQENARMMKSTAPYPREVAPLCNPTRTTVHNMEEKVLTLVTCVLVSNHIYEVE